MDYVKLGVAAGCLLVLSVTHGFFYRAGQNSVQVKWEAAKVEHAQALTAQGAVHRAQERKWGEATTLLVESLRDAQEAARADYENTIAGIESGNLRLRRDLAGCRVPSDTTTAAGDHGASERGLSEARQGMVIRIGRDCDAVALKLTAAQEYIAEVCN